MKVVDLTHNIREEMPIYPGTEPPSLKETSAITEDGFKETMLSFYSHTGTHLDCPAHIFQDGLTTETMKIDRFIGRAAVLDARKAGPIIDRCALEGFLSGHPGLDYLLLRTGWEEKWGQDEYYKGFPVFSKEAAELLVSSGIKGIGLDAISVDSVEDSDLMLHRILLGAGCIIVENLCNLEEVTDKEFTFSAFPLKFEKGDGSPVRAVAIL